MMYITGFSGQLGFEFKKKFTTHEATILNHHELDLSKLDKVEEFLRTTKISTLINAAAYTNVDKAETEPNHVYTINAHAPMLMAKYAQSKKFKFIHYSSDYIFNGQTNSPYTEMDRPDPLNVYGKSKYLSEKLIQEVNPDALILRTSWLYSLHGKNFLTKILNLIDEKNEISIVNDQTGTPTSTTDLVKATLELIKRDANGLYHFSNEGLATWYDFAIEICKLKNKDIHIIPIKSSAFPGIAQRPHFSVLSKDKIKPILSFEISDWRESLSKVMKSNY